MNGFSSRRCHIILNKCNSTMRGRLYNTTRSSLPISSRFTSLHRPLLLFSLLSLLTPSFPMSSASNSSSSSNPLLSRAAIIPPSMSHRYTVIFLHGLGDSSNGFRGVFEQFSLPHTRIVLPNAPVTPVTVNGGMRMQSWYDIYTLDKRQPLNTREDRTGILKSRDALQALITSEAELVGGAHKVIVGGFSQGGALSVLTGLSSPHRLGGIIALSCYLLLRDDYPSIMGPHAREVPVWAYHGREDGMVPYEIGAMSWARLKELGVKVEFRTEEGLGHSVSEDEIELLMKWIRQRFGGEL